VKPRLNFGMRAPLPPSVVISCPCIYIKKFILKVKIFFLLSLASSLLYLSCYILSVHVGQLDPLFWPAANILLLPLSGYVPIGKNLKFLINFIYLLIYILDSLLVACVYRLLGFFVLIVGFFCFDWGFLF
jgi:hypothetical protein